MLAKSFVLQSALSFLISSAYKFHFADVYFFNAKFKQHSFVYDQNIIPYTYKKVAAGILCNLNDFFYLGFYKLLIELETRLLKQSNHV